MRSALPLIVSRPASRAPHATLSSPMPVFVGRNPLITVPGIAPERSSRIVLSSRRTGRWLSGERDERRGVR